MAEPSAATTAAPTGKGPARWWSALRTAVKRGVARDPAFVAVFAALWVFALVPLWAPRFLPLLDLPNHLDAIAIWHRYGNPEWGYSKYYNLNLIPVPYWGYFLPVHLLSYLMPIEIANKVYLSAYALTLPLSVAVLARQMGRSHWLALFAFPLVFNMNFSYGFVTFCAGLVMLTFALVVLDRYLEQPTRRRAWALALLSLALYTTHVLPWMFFGVASIVLVFCHGLDRRRIGTAFLLELPSLALAIYGFRRSANGTTAVQTGPFAYDAKGEDLLGSLQQIPLRIVAGWPSNTAYWVVIILALTWMALLSSARTEADDAEARRNGWPYRLELIVLLAVAAYLFLPMHLFKPVDLWMIGGRFITVVALFGALLPHGPIRGKRKLLLIPVILVSAYYPIALTRKWVEFDRRAAAFRRLMRRVERGSSVLTLVMGDGLDPSVDPNAVPYLQFHAYAQYFAGGYDPWALDTGFPYTRKPGAGLPAPRWKHNETFTFDQHGVKYDYILTKGEWTDHAIFGPDDSGRAPMIAQDLDWRLYSVGQR
ncbi:MAG: hypothetical protein JWM53_4761 [bacterium]|jgi:hypothetical protein|nr:hypothetical protein [bacterium]